MDGEQFMNIIKRAPHILLINPVFPLPPARLQLVLSSHGGGGGGGGGVPLQARVVLLR